MSSDRDRIAVLQPTGAHAYYATQTEAKRLIDERKVYVLRGKQRSVQALRLKSTVFDDSALRLDRASAESRIPVIRMRELLAPSPRRHWASKVSVYSDLRDNPHRSAGIAAARAVRREERAAKIASG